MEDLVESVLDERIGKSAGQEKGGGEWGGESADLHWQSVKAGENGRHHPPARWGARRRSHEMGRAHAMVCIFSHTREEEEKCTPLRGGANRATSSKQGSVRDQSEIERGQQSVKG